MFLGQETATQVSIDSEKDLRVFINDHFHINSVCSAVADIKFNVILLRINEEKKKLRGKELERLLLEYYV